MPTRLKRTPDCDELDRLTAELRAMGPKRPDEDHRLRVTVAEQRKALMRDHIPICRGCRRSYVSTTPVFLLPVVTFFEDVWAGLSKALGSSQRSVEAAIDPEQLERARQKAISDFDPMVRQNLTDVAKWAFPRSQVEHCDGAVWQLWHTSAAGERYVDAQVSLQFRGLAPSHFIAEGQQNLKIVMGVGLTSEALARALRSSLTDD